MSNEENGIKPCSCRKDKSLWIAIAIAGAVVFLLVNLLFFRDNLPNNQVILTTAKYVIAIIILTFSGLVAKHFIIKYCDSIRKKDRNRELLMIGLISSVIFTLTLIAFIIYLPIDYDCIKSLPNDNYQYWRECR